MDVQIISYVILDKSHFSEPVHEEADPRTGRPHHFCQGLLT